MRKNLLILITAVFMVLASTTPAAARIAETTYNWIVYPENLYMLPGAPGEAYTVTVKFDAIIPETYLIDCRYEVDVSTGSYGLTPVLADADCSVYSASVEAEFVFSFNGRFNYYGDEPVEYYIATVKVKVYDRFGLAGVYTKHVIVEIHPVDVHVSITVSDERELILVPSEPELNEKVDVYQGYNIVVHLALSVSQPYTVPVKVVVDGDEAEESIPPNSLTATIELPVVTQTQYVTVKVYVNDDRLVYAETLAAPEPSYIGSYMVTKPFPRIEKSILKICGMVTVYNVTAGKTLTVKAVYTVGTKSFEIVQSRPGEIARKCVDLAKWDQAPSEVSVSVDVTVEVRDVGYIVYSKSDVVELYQTIGRLFSHLFMVVIGILIASGLISFIVGMVTVNAAVMSGGILTIFGAAVFASLPALLVSALRLLLNFAAEEDPIGMTTASILEFPAYLDKAVAYLQMKLTETGFFGGVMGAVLGGIGGAFVFGILGGAMIAIGFLVAAAVVAILAQIIPFLFAIAMVLLMVRIVFAAILSASWATGPATIVTPLVSFGVLVATMVFLPYTLPIVDAAFNRLDFGILQEVVRGFATTVTHLVLVGIAIGSVINAFRSALATTL